MYSGSVAATSAQTAGANEPGRISRARSMSRGSVSSAVTCGRWKITQ